MRALRILDTGLASARWNIAASSALLETHDHHRQSACVRFYSFRACVLLGRGQTAQSSANLDFCKRHDIDIARRITGGGAVYMDPTMLAWDFVTEATTMHEQLSDTIGNAIANGLRNISIPARFRPPYDLRLDGHKISGAATASFGRSFLHQGTLLLACAREPMAQALCIPLSTLNMHTTSLTEAGCARERSALQGAIAGGLAECFRLTPVASELSASEADLAQRDLADEPGLDLTRPDLEPSTGMRG